MSLLLNSLSEAPSLSSIATALLALIVVGCSYQLKLGSGILREQDGNVCVSQL